MQEPSMTDVALVTGFAGYGGRGRNPAGEAAKALEGRSIGGLAVKGRVLPVSYGTLQADLRGLVDELRPRLVIGLGLWPGEPMIRLERVGINVADFEIPDNEGAFLSDMPISGNGAAAVMSTLPLRDIEASLLAAGIPVRISSTAGTFLCNATHSIRRSRTPIGCRPAPSRGSSMCRICPNRSRTSFGRSARTASSSSASAATSLRWILPPL